LVKTVLHAVWRGESLAPMGGRSVGRKVSDVEERVVQVLRLPRLRWLVGGAGDGEVEGSGLVGAVDEVWFWDQLGWRHTQRAVTEMRVLVASSIWWVVRCDSRSGDDGMQIPESFSPSLVEADEESLDGE
jgi:hypothetical protein